MAKFVDKSKFNVDVPEDELFVDSEGLASNDDPDAKRLPREEAMKLEIATRVDPTGANAVVVEYDEGTLAGTRFVEKVIKLYPEYLNGKEEKFKVSFMKAFKAGISDSA